MAQERLVHERCLVKSDILNILARLDEVHNWMASHVAANILHAEEWSKLDPNPETSRRVRRLIARAEGGGDAALRELQSLFPVAPGTAADNQYERARQPRLGFGTAGLRGRMQPGPLGMNDLTVIQTAQGLAASRHVLGDGDDASAGRRPARAVVGYDHRGRAALGLSSRQFALYTKLVFERAGAECTLLDGHVATPVLAFAVTHTRADVGIMVTASHNPKEDNGYKVYGRDGCQIRPPIDGVVARAIAEPGNHAPWTDYGAELRRRRRAGSDGPCGGLSDPVATKGIEDAYFRAIATSGLVAKGEAIAASSPPPPIAYTAMHGVGHPYAKRAFETFGLPPFLAVPSQRDPDAAFSTVPFPNPEEEGALDEALAFATKQGCRLVLAHDPDADRLGVAELGRDWTVFSGDQIGTLLGHWLWETVGKHSDQPVAMCASTVSSKMLAALGRAEGFRVEETLTGFKWIGSRALALRREGYRVLLGYEEAIGFSCGGIVPDKDGISALGVVATMAAHLYSRGETLASRLKLLHKRVGEFACRNGYYRCHDPAAARKVMEQMRNAGKYRKRVGRYEVESIRDLGCPGFDSTTDDKRPTLPISETSPMITFRFTNGCVAQFRASGTEPKFKFYLEMKGNPGEQKVAVENRLREMSGVILQDLLQPAKNGLIIPSNL